MVAFGDYLPEAGKSPESWALAFGLESFDPELETESLRAERFTPPATSSGSSTCRAYTRQMQPTLIHRAADL
jgi:hypothetical protein